jgi:hypothetical protein
LLSLKKGKRPTNIILAKAILLHPEEAVVALLAAEPEVEPPVL